MPLRVGVDLVAIRTELGKSQAEFAALLGVSPRTIQSCEQGWRSPSVLLEKTALLILLAHRNRRDLRGGACWEVTRCAPALRRRCLAYSSRQGNLCWFLTGTLCKGGRAGSWPQKLARCRGCSFFRRLLGGRLPLKGRRTRKS